MENEKESKKHLCTKATTTLLLYIMVYAQWSTMSYIVIYGLKVFVAVCLLVYLCVCGTYKNGFVYVDGKWSFSENGYTYIHSFFFFFFVTKWIYFPISLSG